MNFDKSTPLIFCVVVIWRTFEGMSQVLLSKLNEESWCMPYAKIEDKSLLTHDLVKSIASEKCGIKVFPVATFPSVIVSFQGDSKKQLYVRSYLTGPVCNDDPTEQSMWFYVDNLPKIVRWQSKIISMIKERSLVLDAAVTSKDDPLIDDALNEVFGYASHVDDWVVIKKELLKALPSSYRVHFSTRDPKTKKQRINEFEKNLANRWSALTGRSVHYPI